MKPPTTDPALVSEHSEPTQHYPNGDTAPAYRLAFQVWVVLFLLIICISLVTFLATWFQMASG